jgi:glycosidase
MIDDLWYKNSVIYCLSVGTYMDANGDGVGDFKGLSRRLDYLHGLGITTIWLMPFQPSPGKDDGYDISDYYGVDPRYGTLGDFVEFTHGCKQRGIRVIIDLVVNHTSNEHAWFKSARSKDSRYRDWYIWADRRPANAGKGMLFPGVQKSTWTHDKEAGAWYFHRFYDFQPDLNTSNPLVQAEILKIMGFWIQLGVSGFRILFVHNLDQRPREISFGAGLPGDVGKLLVNLLSEDHSHANEGGHHTLMMEGYGYRWYRVGGLDYLLKRSDIDTKTTRKQRAVREVFRSG